MIFANVHLTDFIFKAVQDAILRFVTHGMWVWLGNAIAGLGLPGLAALTAVITLLVGLKLRLSLRQTTVLLGFVGAGLWWAKSQASGGNEAGLLASRSGSPLTQPASLLPGNPLARLPMRAGPGVGRPDMRGNPAVIGPAGGPMMPVALPLGGPIDADGPALSPIVITPLITAPLGNQHPAPIHHHQVGKPVHSGKEVSSGQPAAPPATSQPAKTVIMPPVEPNQQKTPTAKPGDAGKGDAKTAGDKPQAPAISGGQPGPKPADLPKPVAGSSPSNPGMPPTKTSKPKPSPGNSVNGSGSGSRNGAGNGSHGSLRSQPHSRPRSNDFYPPMWGGNGGGYGGPVMPMGPMFVPHHMGSFGGGHR